LAHENVFGRRGSANGPPLHPPTKVETSRPAAEYVRSAPDKQDRSTTSDFADWRRGQRGRWLAAWALGLLFVSPGLLCFLFQAPLGLSVVMEVAGVAANAWVRRERRRRLQEIVQWDPSDEAD